MTKPMKKMLLIMTIVFSIFFIIYLGKRILISYFISHYEMPPVTISATMAKPKNWQSYLNSIGTLTAVNGVDLSAEVSGIVREIHFESGQSVKKGDLLLVLDDNVEQAQLKDNQAQLKLAQINYERNKILTKKKVVAQSVLDASTAQLVQAQANVEITKAKINQKNITAPFDGRMGIRLVNLGEYLAPGKTIASLQSLDPLYVQFSLPEQYIPQLYLQQPIDIEINLGKAGNAILKGNINAINSKVDQSTRNVLIQATIPNQDLHFYPGMFATIKIWLKSQNDMIALPQTAISYSLHGDSVFIIKNLGKDKHNKPLLKAYRQYVSIGERRGDEVIILKGINAGDEVVTSGQLKLQNETRVVIDNG